MASLTFTDKRDLNKLLEFSSGYVLDFSNRTFQEFVFDAVGLNIYSDKYAGEGTSKGKTLRVFLNVESDYQVGRLLNALINHAASLNLQPDQERKLLIERCRAVTSRLLSVEPSLDALKQQAQKLDAKHLAQLIHRMEQSVTSDPALAIGTAKELIETCCKTILSERGKPVEGTPDIPVLTKATLKELKLVADEIPDAAKGAEVIKRLLSNLGTIGNGLAELRGLYGSGHGKEGKAIGLSPRHAKLAVGAAATLSTFLFDTHQETKP